MMRLLRGFRPSLGFALAFAASPCQAGDWQITYFYGGSNTTNGAWNANGTNRNISFGWNANETTQGQTTGTITATLTWVGVPDNILDPPPQTVPVRQSASASWSVGVTSFPPRVWLKAGQASNGLSSLEVKSSTTLVESGLSKGFKRLLRRCRMGPLRCR